LSGISTENKILKNLTNIENQKNQRFFDL